MTSLRYATYLVGQPLLDEAVLTGSKNGPGRARMTANMAGTALTGAVGTGLQCRVQWGVCSAAPHRPVLCCGVPPPLPPGHVPCWCQQTQTDRQNHRQTGGRGVPGDAQRRSAPQTTPARPVHTGHTTHTAGTYRLKKEDYFTRQLIMR